MATEVRTFFIPDQNAHDIETEVAAFLRSIEVRRIDSAYADGGWRLLVLFEDLRHKEESAQIESVILTALNGWRKRRAIRSKLLQEQVLPDDLMAAVAHFAPSTERELQTIAGGKGFNLDADASEIVQVIRDTLNALVD
ncbi:Aldolase [uncultured Gammaproteobacteria bacterium]